MVSNFSKNDEVALLNSMGVKDVINSLTIDDVAQFLESLGVQVIKSESYLICPTICHNPLEEAETMKLYWYQNYKVFHCYTECNESMSIFELYMKYNLCICGSFSNSTETLDNISGFFSTAFNI